MMNRIVRPLFAALIVLAPAVAVAAPTPASSTVAHNKKMKAHKHAKHTKKSTTAPKETPAPVTAKPATTK